MTIIALMFCFFLFLLDTMFLNGLVGKVTRMAKVIKSETKPMDKREDTIVECVHQIAWIRSNTVACDLLLLLTRPSPCTTHRAVLMPNSYSAGTNFRRKISVYRW